MRGLLRQATDLVVQLRALSQELRHNRAVPGGGPPARSFHLLEDLFRSIGEDASVGSAPSTCKLSLVNSR